MVVCNMNKTIKWSLTGQIGLKIGCQVKIAFIHICMVDDHDNKTCSKVNYVWRYTIHNLNQLAVCNELHFKGHLYIMHVHVMNKDIDLCLQSYCCLHSTCVISSP